MVSRSKLRLLSNVLRYGVIIFACLFVISLISLYIFGYSGFVSESYSITLELITSKEYQEMKATPGVSIMGVAFFPLLTISVISFTTFWFYKLFDNYAKGNFFGDDTMRCYIMLLWTRIVDFFYTAFFDSLIWVFHPVRESFDVKLVFDLKTLFTLVVLIVITYILKMANQLDKENREFV